MKVKDYLRMWLEEKTKKFNPNSLDENMPLFSYKEVSLMMNDLEGLEC